MNLLDLEIDNIVGYLSIETPIPPYEYCDSEFRLRKPRCSLELACIRNELLSLVFTIKIGYINVYPCKVIY